MVNTNLLTFEAFPERVAFEGFDEEVLRGLGMFMARVTDGGADDAAYRVVVGGGRELRRLPAGPPRRRRRPWHRYLRRDDEDIFMMPGVRVRLAPGRAEAVVEWADTGAPLDDFVATMLLETALIHTLAMGGCVVNHAAAFDVDGAALLVVGQSRAGKSTLSAAVLAAGGSVVSDD